jgi:hypothetical protein
MLNNNSTEIQASGMILIFLSFIVLVAPIIQNLLSELTKIGVESVTFLSIMGIFIGIAIFVVGLKSGKSSS